MPVPLKFVDAQRIFHKVGGDEMHFEISDSNEAADPKYYGYLASNGAWIIMEVNEGAGTYRYCAGSSLYAANWAAKGVLSYVLYSALGGV